MFLSTPGLMDTVVWVREPSVNSAVERLTAGEFHRFRRRCMQTLAGFQRSCRACRPLYVLSILGVGR